VRALEAAALRIPEQTEQGEPAEHGLANSLVRAEGVLSPDQSVEGFSRPSTASDFWYFSRKVHKKEYLLI
jgi:hypothetical protein